MRQTFYTIFIWWAVLGFSIWFGGTIFSMSVIVPMWSYDLPDSARFFFTETKFTEYIYNFFGPPWMAIRNLPVFIALGLSWHSMRHRKYLLITSGILVTSILYTVLHIYSINDELMLQAGKNSTDEELVVLADQWIWLDRVRFFVMAIGYYYLLKAFRLPVEWKN